MAESVIASTSAPNSNPSARGRKRPAPSRSPPPPLLTFDTSPFPTEILAMIASYVDPADLEALFEAGPEGKAAVLRAEQLMPWWRRRGGCRALGRNDKGALCVSGDLRVRRVAADATGAWIVVELERGPGAWDGGSLLRVNNEGLHEELPPAALLQLGVRPHPAAGLWVDGTARCGWWGLLRRERVAVRYGTPRACVAAGAGIQPLAVAWAFESRGRALLLVPSNVARVVAVDACTCAPTEVNLNVGGGPLEERLHAIPVCGGWIVRRTDARAGGPVNETRPTNDALGHLVRADGTVEALKGPSVAGRAAPCHVVGTICVAANEHGRASLLSITRGKQDGSREIVPIAPNEAPDLYGLYRAWPRETVYWSECEDGVPRLAFLVRPGTRVLQIVNVANRRQLGREISRALGGV
eukprot:tig00000042_g15658.t1